jgi:hypothetical protein
MPAGSAAAGRPGRPEYSALAQRHQLAFADDIGRLGFAARVGGVRSLQESRARRVHRSPFSEP